MDVLLPRSDTAVLVQASVLLVVVVATGWRVRSDHDWLRVVLGVGLLLAGALVLRALH